MSSVQGADSRSRVALGAACWIASLEFFAAQAVAQSAWVGHYSLSENTISDLGATVRGIVRLGSYSAYVNSPLHVLMNASFVVTGLLMLLGMYFLRGAWPGKRRALWGAALFALAGIGKIVVGIFPKNINTTAHEVGSLGIVFANIAIVLLGLALSGPRTRWLAGASLVLGGIGLVGLIMFAGGSHLVGLAERLADYPVFVWMVWLGIHFRHRPLLDNREPRSQLVDPVAPLR